MLFEPFHDLKHATGRRVLERRSHREIWRTNTLGLQVRYERSLLLPEEGRVKVKRASRKTCPFHIAVEDQTQAESDHPLKESELADQFQRDLVVHVGL